MNEIQIFTNPQFGEIRTAGTQDQPLFCLADLCRVLEISNVTMLRSRLDQKGLSQTEVLTNGGKQQMYFVNEKNLYKVIMRSDKPQAEPFQDWVFGEVLPSIRKTGGYSIANLSRKELAMMVIQSEEEKERLMLENQRQQKAIEDAAPKVVFADAIVGSQSSCLIGELAKIISQRGYKIGQNRLFKWLRDNGYIGKWGEYYNIPCQRYIEQGLFEIKKTTHSENGVMKTTSTPKVTGKGQQYFVNLFLKQQPQIFSQC